MSQMDIARAQMEPCVVKFYRQYMQQIDDLSFPPGSLLVQPDVQHCLYRYFFDESQNKYLPPARYQTKVLKHVIREIEKNCKDPEEEQVLDPLMEHMALLSTIPRRDPFEEAQQLYVHSYFPPLPLDVSGLKPILINEARNLLSKGNNVGLRTWEASLHLAWYLLKEKPELVKNRNVIELGAGTGFLSILCASFLEANYVLATDGLGHVCESMQFNIELNKQNNIYSQSPPEVREFDWTDKPQLDDMLNTAKYHARQYDLVLGADITYHPDILRPLAETIRRLVDANPDVTVLISSTIRSFETFSKFVKICRDDLDFSLEETRCVIPDGLRYSGLFHTIATEIRIVSLTRRSDG